MNTKLEISIKESGMSLIIVPPNCINLDVLEECKFIIVNSEKIANVISTLTHISLKVAFPVAADDMKSVVNCVKGIIVRGI